MFDNELVDHAFQASQKNPEYGHNVLDIDERNFLYVIIGVGIAVTYFLYLNSKAVNVARRNFVADLRGASKVKVDEDNWQQFASTSY